LLLVFCSALAIARSDSLPEGYYAKNGLVPLFQVDAYGDSSLKNLPEEYGDTARTLQLPPNLQATYSKGDQTFTVSQLLGTKMVAFDKKGLFEAEGGNICADSRTSLGKLMLCLTKLHQIVNDQARLVKNKPAAAKANEELRARIVAAMVALRTSHNIPNDVLSHVRAKSGALALSRAGMASVWPKKPNSATQNGSPLRDPSGSGEGPLEACLMSFNATSENQRIVDPESVCQRVTNTPLQAFTPQLQKIFLRPSIEGYFEAMRMESIAQVAQASFMLTGRRHRGSCGPFTEGIKKQKTRFATRLASLMIPITFRE
jgi:hypothetical protein